MSEPDPIPVTAGYVEFTPESWPQGRGEAPTFILTTPTGMDRDRLGTRLIRLGLNGVTIELIRATIVEELFGFDWEKGSPEANELHAEELANFLDGFWINATNHNAAMEMHQQREVQRMLDEAAGAPARPPYEAPKSLLTIRDIAREAVVVDQLTRGSQRVRDLLGRQNDYQRQEGQLMVRIHVVEVRGLFPGHTEWLPGRDPRMDVMQETALSDLREALPDQVWNDLIYRCRRLYLLSETERKNSDSPPENKSTENSSTESSGDLESSDGNSTTSNTSPAPDAASEPTTAGSRNSRSKPVAKAA